MFLINTTYIVACGEAERRFLEWSTGCLLPALTAQNGFEHVVLSRILAQVDPASRNYAVQYRVADLTLKTGWDRDVYPRVRALLKVPQEAVLEFVTEMEML